MQKINKPDQADKAQDLSVQPLTAEEIEQVSGGAGMSRTGTLGVPTRNGTTSRGAALSVRKTVFG